MDIVLGLRKRNIPFIHRQQTDEGEGFLALELRSAPKFFGPGDRLYMGLVDVKTTLINVEYVALAVEVHHSFWWEDKFFPVFLYWIKWVDLREADVLERGLHPRHLSRWGYAKICPSEEQAEIDRRRYQRYLSDLNNERMALKWE